MAKVVLLVPNSPSWLGPVRAGIFAQTLQDAGHKTAVHTVGRSRKIDPNWIADASVVINHTMVASQDQIRELAHANSGQQFIHVNHSAIAQIERSAKQASRMTASLFSARSVENIWYGSVDIYDSQLRRASGVDRCIHFPGPGYLLPQRQYTPLQKPLRIVVGGRCDAIKNLFNQMIAVKLSGLDCQFELAMKPTREVLIMAKLLGLTLKVHNRLPHSQWLQFLSHCDLVMSASLAESFCFVAAEAMQIGVPTIVSPAIKFGDGYLTADPNDPESICEAIHRAVGVCHERNCNNAHKLARQAVAARNATYVKQVNRLAELSYERC